MWFHADVDLEHHSKSLTLRSRLGWTSDQLLARMHRFLAWMRRENPDGEMTGIDAGVMALTMGAESKDGPQIIQAMIEAGFIDVVGDKTMCHNWMERNGRWIRDAERKRLSRDSPRTSNGQPEDRRSSRARTPAPGAGVGVGVGVGVGAGEENQNRLDRQSSGDAVSPNPITAMIVKLAKAKRMPTGRKDWRPQVWEDAKAIAKTPAQASEFMELAGWLRKNGVLDHVTIQRVFRLVVQHNISNPMAYFTKDGTAINSLIGERSVERAEEERRAIDKADRELGIARMP